MTPVAKSSSQSLRNKTADMVFLEAQNAAGMASLRFVVIGLPAMACVDSPRTISPCEVVCFALNPLGFVYSSLGNVAGDQEVLFISSGSPGRIETISVLWNWARTQLRSAEGNGPALLSLTPVRSRSG